MKAVKNNETKIKLHIKLWIKWGVNTDIDMSSVEWEVER